MTETLYGFPITIMEMDNSYIFTWKKVTLVIHNKTKKTPKENELIIDIISNTGAKGEGITLLCHILKKLKDDPDSGVNDETLVRLFASAKCRDTTCKSNLSINESRYSKNNMNLVRYYQRYGFEYTGSLWIQTNINKILAKCQTGGFKRTRKSRKTLKNKCLKII
jgi:hypothetical protein